MEEIVRKSKINWYSKRIRKKKCGRSTIWHDNGWKLSKTDERCQLTDSGSPQIPSKLKNTKSTLIYIKVKLLNTKEQKEKKTIKVVEKKNRLFSECLVIAFPQ